MQEVFILGQIGKAVYEHNDRYYVMGVPGRSGAVECRPGDVSLLFDSGAEVSVLYSEGIDSNALTETLDFSTQKYRGLSMMLSALDRELTPASRLLAVEAAEELLQDHLVWRFVRGRFLARPLPDSADIDGAIRFAESVGASTVGSLYREVKNSQAVTKILIETWKDVAPEFFNSIDEQAENEKLLIESGVFAEMGAALSSHDDLALNSIVIEYGTKPDLIASIPRAPQVLNAVRTGLMEKFSIVTKRIPPLKEADSNRIETEVEILGAESNVSNSILNLIASFDKRRDWRPSKAHEVGERIKNQLSAVGKLIRKGDLERANEFLYGLIEFHLHHSEKEHVAMSLCSLATIATNTRSFDLAKDLVGYAFALNVDDVFIWTTQAEMLKAKGLIDEALRVYEDALGLFSDDVVMFNGYAEVLKDMGQLNSSLKVYEETMARFPDNVVARDGYAEALKDMGQLDSSLKVYEETVARFPDNVYARNGSAEVLKSMGLLDSSLKIYEDTWARFPNDAVVRTGYASLLLVMDEFDELNSVLSYLPEGKLISRDHWIDHHILAMAQLKQGYLDEAILRLEKGWQKARWTDVKSYYTNALGLARMRKKEFAKAIEVLTDNVVHLDVFQKQRRFAFIAHSKAELGQVTEAARFLAEIENTANPHLASLKDALTSRFNLSSPRLQISANPDIPSLEKRIDHEEFFLAMAA